MVPAPQPGAIHPFRGGASRLEAGEAVSQTRLKRSRRIDVILRSYLDSVWEPVRLSEKPGA